MAKKDKRMDKLVTISHKIGMEGANVQLKIHFHWILNPQMRSISFQDQDIGMFLCHTSLKALSMWGYELQSPGNVLFQSGGSLLQDNSYWIRPTNKVGIKRQICLEQHSDVMCS
ncbi:hypothetical protein SLA2020_273710 [Shorea laevis]